MSSLSSETNPVTLRQLAHRHLGAREPDEAERAFRRLLEAAPDDLEALLFLADRHYARGEPAQALAMLDHADRQHANHPAVLLQRGAAQLAAGDFAAAASCLQQGLRQAPGRFIARLQLGIALEQSGDASGALRAYYTALRTAQRQGRWLSDATTAPGLRETVAYANRYVLAGRHELFLAMLEPLRQRHGPSALERVEHSLAMQLGVKPLELPDPRQRPRFFYFAGIPSQPYYARDRFPWLEALEQAAPAILAELQQLLREGDPLEAFLGAHEDNQTPELLRAHGSTPAAWDAWFFHRNGQRYDEHCARCPDTTRVLDALPLVRIRDHAPETLFSVLKPGTHILPHRGVTNTRLVTHLPLIIPEDCALNVSDELHVWQPGRCVTFDDTFEHEAWNRSSHTRVVLLVDSWNPDLTEVERLAVTDLVEAIGDFNDECEVAAAD